MGGSVTLAWHQGQGGKGTATLTQEALGAGPEVRRGERMCRECRAAVSWGSSASASPAALLFLSPDACCELSVAGICLLPGACKKIFASGTWTVVEWCCEYILNCSFVISVLDVHTVIK